MKAGILPSDIAGRDAPNSPRVCHPNKARAGRLLDILRAACRSLGISLLEFHLVGSGHNELLADDLDVILVVSEAKTTCLHRLRRHLANEIGLFHETVPGIPVHFKLFTPASLASAARYDGVRIYEFQRRHMALQDRRILTALEPVLSVETLHSSMLIQLSYSLLCEAAEVEEPAVLARKLEFRAKRNAQIASLIGRRSITPQALLSHARSSAIFAALEAAISCGDPWALEAALERYYALFPHEGLNKRDFYSSPILRGRFLQPAGFPS